MVEKSGGLCFCFIGRGYEMVKETKEEYDKEMKKNKKKELVKKGVLGVAVISAVCGTLEILQRRRMAKILWIHMNGEP